MSDTAEYLPRPGEFDPLAGDATTEATPGSGETSPASGKVKPPREKLIHFFTYFNGIRFLVCYYLISNFHFVAHENTII